VLFRTPTASPRKGGYCMTSPNRLNDNRFSQLLEMVLSPNGPEIPEGLSEEERMEVERLRALFAAIDDAWQAPEAERQRVHALFLQKLETKHPGHPWVRTNTVRTLGELLRFDRDAAPALPAETLAKLESDPTPVETLLDPARRTAVVGRVVQQVALPNNLIKEFMRWLNRALAQLSPSNGSGTQGLLFTRTQNKQKRHQIPDQD
jgi:hypothetical protein